jgi:hypothetical protein
MIDTRAYFDAFDALFAISKIIDEDQSAEARIEKIRGVLVQSGLRSPDIAAPPNKRLAEMLTAVSKLAARRRGKKR